MLYLAAVFLSVVAAQGEAAPQNLRWLSNAGALPLATGGSFGADRRTSAQNGFLVGLPSLLGTRAAAVNHYYQRQQALTEANRRAQVDLAELGRIAGSGAPHPLLQPYYTLIDLTADGERTSRGLFFDVLPDAEISDEPIYRVGGRLGQSRAPKGVKYGFQWHPLG